MFGRLNWCFQSKSLSPVIKLFLIKAHIYSPRNSAFVGSFFNNLDSQAFPSTWEYLFLKRLHPVRPRETGVWEDNIGLLSWRHTFGFFLPVFFLAVILPIVFLATEKQQGWGLGQKNSKSGQRSRNHYPLTETINTNMSPEGSYNDWESDKLAFVKCKRQVDCSMPLFSYLEWSFICIAAFLISETALWFCAIKIYF